MVSVVVLNWNQKSLTARSLESLRRQTLPDIEVILVDNGSTDGSVDTLSHRFPDVHIVALPDNRGFAGGNNAGIRHAKGDYIALLNNDTEVDPGWLEAMVSALDAHPEAGFCASKLVLYDRPDRLDTAGDYYTIAGAAGKTGHLDASDNPQYNHPRKVFGACAGAACYRRSMLEDVGLFDEDFFITQEDVDLSFRAQLKGYACLYVPTAIVYHHLNASIKAYSHEYVYYGHRNLEVVFLKNMPLPLLILSSPLHLLDVVLSFCFFVSKRRGGSFLRAKWDVLTQLPSLLRKRRVIQQERRVPLGDIWALLEKRWLKLKLANWRRQDPGS